jgi:hypothetical protein
MHIWYGASVGSELSRFLCRTREMKEPQEVVRDDESARREEGDGG